MILEERTAMLEGLGEGALEAEVFAEPLPGKRLYFRLGETMQQICYHGTHHRAQTINMLRHLGEESPRIDYITFRRSVAC